MRRIAVKALIATCVMSIAAVIAGAQSNFAERCIGVWEGEMLIYREGAVRDRVPIRLTVSATKTPGDYTWRTDYLSATRPMTKDYLLRVKDASKGIYVTDEGGGVELINYLHGDKLYNVFETGGVMLTASYEIRGDELVFEVTSGTKVPGAQNGITNYSVPNLQRAILKRVKREISVPRQ